MSKRRVLTLASLAGLSGLVVAMVVVRVAYTGNSQYVSMLWNLFLAWIPFALAVRVYDGYRRRAGGLWLWAGGLLWLVFFPNAPYIVTDLKYLRDWTGALTWYDAVLTSAAAGCGLLLGFISLYLMQSVVRRALGMVNAWLFALAALALSSFGVYLGRFQRWNSWDVFTRPGVLAGDLWSGLVDPLDHPRTIAVTVFFTFFLGATYLVFYSLAGKSVPERVER
ncbi:MAG TPA: DUF1361 domain-containing protein [Gaiellaceae bacterium]|nr:DUF1361 domain-containing protein [Gaiellaceae bacterium]